MVDPVTSTILGQAGAWIWANYGKDIVDALGGVAKQKWVEFSWTNAAEKG